jgi:aryl-alcohol dehydrogenase-like predicted oxidoreductase
MIAVEALRLSLRQQQSAESKSAICRRAFDLGSTHFDFANNNEPPPSLLQRENPSFFN